MLTFFSCSLGLNLATKSCVFIGPIVSKTFRISFSVTGPDDDVEADFVKTVDEDFIDAVLFIE